MKNFSELLATDLKLDVVINGTARSAGLHELLSFDAEDTVTVDSIEILPKYRHLASNGVLDINEPFYCWHHRISAQGWLLVPY
jgi:hypothetical protein